MIKSRFSLLFVVSLLIASLACVGGAVAQSTITPVATSTLQYMPTGSFPLSTLLPPDFALTQAARPTSALLPPEAPRCTPPDFVIIDNNDALALQWTMLLMNASGDFVTDLETLHYEMTQEGDLLIWKNEDKNSPPTFYPSETDEGRIFVIPLSSYKAQPSGPIFFFVCFSGGGFIDATRAVPAQ